MAQHPSPWKLRADDEEELLMQQQQMQPLPPALRAATVSRKGPPPITSSSAANNSGASGVGTKPSRFAAQRAAAAAAGTAPHGRSDSAALDEAPALVPVVGDIVERPTVAPAAMPTAPASRPTMMPSPWTAPRGGFPRVAHRSLGATTPTSTPAAAAAAAAAAITRVPPLAPVAWAPAPAPAPEEEAGPQKRGPAAEAPTMHHRPHAGGVSQQEEQEEQEEHEGGRLAAEIHDENVRKLTSMSTDEIAAAQAEIVQALDPRLLDMLRSRARRQPPLPPLHHPQPQPQQQQHG